jgi:hypothetical protein
VVEQAVVVDVEREVVSTWEAHVLRQVTNELAWRGLPEPRHVELLRGDWLAYRRHRPTKEALPQARGFRPVSPTTRTRSRAGT